jgi:hypothetical protein
MTPFEVAGRLGEPPTLEVWSIAGATGPAQTPRRTEAE